MSDIKYLTCPLLKGPCIQEKCMMWLEVTKHDEKGTYRDDGCGIARHPILQIEIIHALKRNQAAIEDFRNHNINQQNKFLNIETTKLKLVEKKIRSDNKNKRR